MCASKATNGCLMDSVIAVLVARTSYRMHNWVSKLVTTYVLVNDEADEVVVYSVLLLVQMN